MQFIKPEKGSGINMPYCVSPYSLLRPQRTGPASPFAHAPIQATQEHNQPDPLPERHIRTLAAEPERTDDAAVSIPRRTHYIADIHARHTSAMGHAAQSHTTL